MVHVYILKTKRNTIITSAKKTTKSDPFTRQIQVTKNMNQSYLDFSGTSSGKDKHEQDSGKTSISTSSDPKQGTDESSDSEADLDEDDVVGEVSAGRKVPKKTPHTAPLPLPQKVSDAIRLCI
jgi:hypothetical protein